MKKLTLLTLLVAAGLFAACDSFVENTPDPVDQAPNEALNQAQEIPFLINGVAADFAAVVDNGYLLADLLSDSHVFGNNGDATFPTYRDIDLGEINRANNSSDTFANYAGEFRYLSDQLVSRIENEMSFEGETDAETAELEALREEGLYNGYLYGGIARYMLAAYQQVNPGGGGVVIEARGSAVPASEAYSAAQSRLDEALNHVSFTGDDADAAAYRTRVVNSIKARIAISQNNFSAADGFAANGLEEGDASFDALYSTGEPNLIYGQSGVGRQQVVVAQRIVDYVDNNPDEAARLPLRQVDDGSAEFTQDLYPNQDSPIPFITWQEMNLIRAEAALQGQGSGDPLALVNAVRASHDLDPLGSIDLETLLVERDKELFTQGQRLVDQRRYDGQAPASVSFHLPDNVWDHLPVSQQECTDNGNITCENVPF